MIICALFKVPVYLLDFSVGGGPLEGLPEEVRPIGDLELLRVPLHHVLLQQVGRAHLGLGARHDGVNHHTRHVLIWSENIE